MVKSVCLRSSILIPAISNYFKQVICVCTYSIYSIIIGLIQTKVEYLSVIVYVINYSKSITNNYSCYYMPWQGYNLVATFAILTSYFCAILFKVNKSFWNKSHPPHASIVFLYFRKLNVFNSAVDGSALPR